MDDKQKAKFRKFRQGLHDLWAELSYLPKEAWEEDENG